MIQAHMNYLKSSTAVGLFMTVHRDHLRDVHMRAGFELGMLTVINDAAYEKATKRKRTMVVYTSPEERAMLQLLK